MPNYDQTFNARGNLYNEAMTICPAAREPERERLLARLQPCAGEVVVDAPAGGGYLAEGVAARGAEVVCIEPAARFAEAIAGRFTTHICPLTDMHLPDSQADKLGSLAGLHHLDADEVGCFFQQAWRVLKPGGRIVVADVKANTPTATFLNGPVDEWTETGHKGRFFDEGMFTEHLTAAGFEQIEETWDQFSWDYPDHETMVCFAWHLFGMTRATMEMVEAALTEHLKPWTDDAGTHMRWSLIYASAIKPAYA
ncbi:class I SAM-dependent methyltransferase [Phycisphaerales bacterium AB-hyl4]|uniref:Class I SAM-dependent methyltransferase n=1 Tax=Natronomicrosphaera hydrolytica TaxID=3242702 RepID=A0ABV4U930_9BACT